MSCHCQTSILPDGAKFGIFIEADLKTEDYEGIANACSKLQSIEDELKNKFPNDMLGMSIGFGAKLWNKYAQTIDGRREGHEIKPFEGYGHGMAPATQHDLLIHIQSMRNDINLDLAIKVWALLRPYFEPKDETHGYRMLEDRGHDGFVDGTENPKDEDAVKAAVIAQEFCDAGGSYVLVQKYIHDMDKWNALSVQTQEASVGRKKDSDEELDKSVRLPDSHLGRTDIAENGVDLKILRRSLPYGDITGDRGLIFCGYCATLHNLDQQLKSMFGDLDGKIDLLVHHFSKPVTGSFYFVPNQERLHTLRVQN